MQPKTVLNISKKDKVSQMEELERNDLQVHSRITATFHLSYCNMTKYPGSQHSVSVLSMEVDSKTSEFQANFAINTVQNFKLTCNHPRQNRNPSAMDR